MAQLSIQINGRAYSVGCEDGQEAHLLELAKMFDRQVRQVSQDVGQLGETRLFLMGALLLADELADLKLRYAALQADAQRSQAGHGTVELKAIAALEAAAKRIEQMAAE